MRLAAAAMQWPGSTSALGGVPLHASAATRGGIEGELRTVPQGEPVGDHFNPPVIGDGHINVHVRDTHIPRDASATLTADARDRSFQRRGARGEDIAAAPPAREGRDDAGDALRGWQRRAARACDERACETHLSDLPPASRALRSRKQGLTLLAPSPFRPPTRPCAYPVPSSVSFYSGGCAWPSHSLRGPAAVGVGRTPFGDHRAACATSGVKDCRPHRRGETKVAKALPRAVSSGGRGQGDSAIEGTEQAFSSPGCPSLDDRKGVTPGSPVRSGTISTCRTQAESTTPPGKPRRPKTVFGQLVGIELEELCKAMCNGIIVVTREPFREVGREGPEEEVSAGHRAEMKQQPGALEAESLADVGFVAERRAEYQEPLLAMQQTEILLVIQHDAKMLVGSPGRACRGPPPSPLQACDKGVLWKRTWQLRLEAHGSAAPRHCAGRTVRLAAGEGRATQRALPRTPQRGVQP